MKSLKLETSTCCCDLSEMFLAQEPNNSYSHKVLCYCSSMGGPQVQLLVAMTTLARLPQFRGSNGDDFQYWATWCGMTHMPDLRDME
uniref:Uncharacterized protein n=1 Tax=Romanomermis culicivorax TaxID=13658 RepID=A0A915JQS1_ROMCU